MEKFSTFNKLPLHDKLIIAGIGGILVGSLLPWASMFRATINLWQMGIVGLIVIAPVLIVAFNLYQKLMMGKTTTSQSKVTIMLFFSVFTLAYPLYFLIMSNMMRSMMSFGTKSFSLLSEDTIGALLTLVGAVSILAGLFQELSAQLKKIEKPA